MLLKQIKYLLFKKKIMGEETNENNEKLIVYIYRGKNNGMINFDWLIKTK